MASPAEGHAVRLAREMKSWKSFECRVRQRATTAGHSGEGIIEYHYIETAEGQRFYEEVQTGKTIDLFCLRSYRDGQKCAEVAFKPGSDTKQRAAEIGLAFRNEGKIGSTDRPKPFDYFYAGKVPLYEALPRAEYLGTGRSLGRYCDLFLFPNIKWVYVYQNVVFYLDRTTSIPLRLEHYRTREDVETRKPSAYWQAESLDEVQGYHIPLRSVAISHHQDGPDMPITDLKGEYEVTSLEYNKEYPASTFWPVLQPGVTVTDRLGEQENVYRIPDPHGEMPKIETVANPVRAAPPGADGTAPGSWIGIALGAGVLMAAFVLWWRRR